MTLNKAENYCVKINCNGEVGSGVLIPGDTTFYVFTAAHCLGSIRPEITDIKIFKQSDYKAELKKIRVVAIKEYDSEKDYALIEIDFEDEHKMLYKFKFGNGFIPGTEVHFCGYQGINNSEYRPFPSKIVTNSIESRCFRIKLTEGETFHQGGEQGQFIAGGLSGSGVFVYRHKSPYLIGILNKVITENAWNNDVDCCSINHIENYLPDIIDLSDLNELRSWEINIEKEYNEFEIQAFKDTKSEFFETLYRKNLVLFPEIEKANRVTTNQIKRYLAMLENIRQLDNEAPELYIKFKDMVKRYIDIVDENYNRAVSTSNEAIDQKKQLQSSLKDELSFLPRKMDIDFADFQIIEWLGICTLNFTKND
ncbi:trypsin-like serine protease [Sphingobacterium siyangense]|uniref:trypsin-like serine protease n=1 Tax=Sphingobacterium siyangense TaxID=459529 RepID=UPI002FD9ED64